MGPGVCSSSSSGRQTGLLTVMILTGLHYPFPVLGDYSLEGLLKHGVMALEGKPIDFTYGRNVCHSIVLAASKLHDPGSSGAAAIAGKAFHVTKGLLDRWVGSWDVRLPDQLKV